MCMENSFAESAGPAMIATVRFLLSCAAIAVAPVHATEIFVSSAGSDTTGNGSAAAPYRTLAHTLDPANGIVAAGDTVTIRGPAGSNLYEECEVRLRVRLTLRSPPGERAHIHCDIANVDTVAVQIDPEASGSRLSNLEISGGYYYGVFLQTDWEQGGNEAGHGPLDVVLEDLHIHDTGRDAIKITPHSDRAIIRRSLIERSGAIYPPGTPTDEKNAEGIDNVNGSGMVVEDSTIRDTATTGLYFKGGAANVLIQRNRIESAGAAGILVGFDTSPEFFDLDDNPGWYEALNATVKNNIVIGANWAGIGLYASKDALVANNTVVDTARAIQAGIYFGVTLQDYDPNAGRPPNTNPRIVNNLVVQDGGDCAGIRWADEIEPGGLHGLIGPAGMDFNAFHNRAGACVFFDSRPGSALGSGGFSEWQAGVGSDAHSFETPITVQADGHLLPGSAAIDAGTALAQVSDDIDRQPRTAPLDIGADEAGDSTLFLDGFESLP